MKEKTRLFHIRFEVTSTVEIPESWLDGIDPLDHAVEAIFHENRRDGNGAVGDIEWELDEVEELEER